MRRHLLAGTSFLALLVGSTSAGAEVINYSGLVVDVPILVTGTYDITAAGAQGGATTNSAAGGMGAIIGGDVFLTAGTELQVVVGGMGLRGDGGYRYGGGGGGGSFVFTSTSSPLVIAGGGGGAGWAGGNGGAGQTGVSGQAGSGTNGGSAGIAGAGGGVGTYAKAPLGYGYNGGGGGGWAGSGGGNPPKIVGNAYGGNGPLTFAGGLGYAVVNVSRPPTATYAYGNGGFGGGGGGGWQGGGGGGGFSGGGGGSGAYASYGGGGGGSYVAPDFTPTELLAGDNGGNGYVSINLIPEPGTLGLLTSALLGLGLIRRRRG